MPSYESLRGVIIMGVGEFSLWRVTESSKEAERVDPSNPETVRRVGVAYGNNPKRRA